MSKPESATDPAAVFTRVLQHSDRLFEALEDLAALGGLPALARVMKPASVKRAAESLRSIQSAIKDELARPLPRPRKPRPRPPADDGGPSDAA